MALFDNIKKYSKLRGYNLQTTAEKAGLSKNAIYGYNHGKQPSVETLKAIANVLDVSVEELLGEKPKKQAPTKQKVDIADDDVIMTFEGKEIPPEDIELMRRLLRGGQK